MHRVRKGSEVLPAIYAADQDPALIVLDLQIGATWAAWRTCMGIRNEEGVVHLPRIPVLMLLDRAVDDFLARRCDADGWLIKPLDAFRLRRAADALRAGGEFHEAGAHTARRAPPKRSGAASVAQPDLVERPHPSGTLALPPGCSAAWQRASFGTKRSWVQIPPPRPNAG